MLTHAQPRHQRESSRAVLRTVRQPVSFVFAFITGDRTAPLTDLLPGERVTIDLGDPPREARSADWFALRIRRAPMAGPIRVGRIAPGDTLGIAVHAIRAASIDALPWPTAVVALVRVGSCNPVRLPAGQAARWLVNAGDDHLLFVGVERDGKLTSGRWLVELSVDPPSPTGMALEPDIA